MNQSKQLIQTQQQVLKSFVDLDKKCLMIENYEDPGVTVPQLLKQLSIIEYSIRQLRTFSPNQTLKQVHTELLSLLVLPYHIGNLYGKISESRKENLEQSKNYLIAFLNLCDHFHSQEEQLFLPAIKKIWKNMNDNENYRPQRQDLIASEKQKIAIRKRYQNAQKIKEESDQRQAIKDYIMLQLYDAITQLKLIKQQMEMLKYKDSLAKDPEVQAKHQEEMQKPIPKMKVMQIKKPQEIQQFMIPPPNQAFTKTKKELIAQVWQENANKPTISLQQVALMEYQNMQNRVAREQAQKQANKQDTDTDKEWVDDREKKKQRYWDDWKDNHQKGAGNRNGR